MMNQETLLDYIYERQLAKFPDQTREQTERKLRSEIRELQDAHRKYFFGGGSAEEIMYERADVIIMANRLYHDFQDELAWAIIDSMYDYEMAKFVEAKWKIVESRCYVKGSDGTYQHKELHYGKYPTKSKKNEGLDTYGKGA